MIQIAQHIAGGIVVNTIIVDAAATVTNGVITLPSGAILTPPNGDSYMLQSGAQIGWTLSGGSLVAPTPSAPSIPLATLVAEAKTAVSAAASAVVTAVMPDAAHQAAFQNAAAILNGNGGAAPTTGPLATAFGALATAYGLSTANFVTLVLDAQAASLTLAAAVATFNTAASAATSSSALATALAAFETALGGVVSAVNAVLVSQITAPAPIVIVGINS